MKKRINAKFMVISALAVILTGVCSSILFYNILETRIFALQNEEFRAAIIQTLMVQMIITAICVCTIVFILCTIWSRSLTKKIMLPIDKMADNIMLTDEEVVYDEMRPFVEMIRQQHVDILQNAKMRQEFSANVSHELKTPLTAISGYAELIANGMTKKKDTQHFASEIHKGAERLQYLINDIIKLSELDDGDTSFEFEEVDLYEITKACAETLRLTAENNGVYIYVEGSSTKVNGNRTLMEELVYNLCSNAIRYNREGGSVILFTHMQNGQPILEVKDTGIGIPKEQQERVFERFYRVDKSRSKNTGGTGLGLAIVKHIVAQHNADISLVSEEGKGTEIKVIF